MKKFLILIILLFCLTGCSDPNRDFTKECKQITKLNNYKEEILITVSYNNKDEVTKVVMEKKYMVEDKATLDSIKQSTISYNQNLKENKGIKFSTKESEKTYQVMYELIVPDTNETTLKQFDIKENSIKYFNYLRKNGIDCI